MKSKFNKEEHIAHHKTTGKKLGWTPNRTLHTGKKVIGILRPILMLSSVIILMYRVQLNYEFLLFFFNSL
jgi:hypothetical protein